MPKRSRANSETSSQWPIVAVIIGIVGAIILIPAALFFLWAGAFSFTAENSSGPVSTIERTIPAERPTPTP